MLGGRFLPIVAVLAIAGSLARKQPVPATAGTFPTGTPLFAGLLVGVILIVVALTYLVLALGLILEQLELRRWRVVLALFDRAILLGPRATAC